MSQIWPKGEKICSIQEISDGDGWMDRTMDGQNDGWTDRRIDGWKDRWTDIHTDHYRALIELGPNKCIFSWMIGEM